MPDIPKIARQRLEAMTSPGPHPDQDLLNAFLEKALAERERQPILEHLAHCADCREVVSLAVPPMEAAAPAPVRAGWLSWPVLRWAAAAACVVVVGAAVTLHFRDQGRMATFTQEKETTAAMDKSAKVEAKAEAPNNLVAANADSAQVILEKRAVVATSGKAKQAESGLALKLPAPAAPKSSDVPAVAPPQQPAAAAPEPARSRADLDDKKVAETVEVAAANESAAVEVTGPAPGKAKEEFRKSTAQASAEMGAVAYKASNTVEKDALSSVNGIVPVPRWTLSSDGTLQRSLNGGKSWETIPVASQAKFRALAAFGQEIWVGGSAGALYHSLDAGAHWIRVKPVAGGTALTVDIIGVEFTDPQHGKLTTTSETWFTSDGGQNWTKQ